MNYEEICIEKFFIELSKRIIINEKVKKKLKTAIRFERFSEKQIISESNKLSPYLYFICDGILQVFKTDAKEKPALSVHFGFKESFVGCPDALTSCEVSQYGIKALKDSVVVVIDKSTLNSLCKTEPALQQLYTKISTELLLESFNHMTMLLRDDAQKNYMEGISKDQRYSEIPVKVLSTFLGIHPNSLSRIRKISNTANRV